MKIYTRTGDTGQTGLFGGLRVPKNDPRVEAYGSIDELNALIGLARASTLAPSLDLPLGKIQNDLFVIGAELACAPEKSSRLKMSLLNTKQITLLEELIDDNEAKLPPLTHFLLPGGSPGGASLHLARTVARRAERCCIELSLRSEILIYLNRLSDLLFVFARRANQLESVVETPWKKPEA